jgi:hypothetical protein
MYNMLMDGNVKQISIFLPREIEKDRKKNIHAVRGGQKGGQIPPGAIGLLPPLGIGPKAFFSYYIEKKSWPDPVFLLHKPRPCDFRPRHVWRKTYMYRERERCDNT